MITIRKLTIVLFFWFASLAIPFRWDHHENVINEPNIRSELLPEHTGLPITYDVKLPIRVGYTNIPPLAMQHGGIPIGISVDTFSYIANKSGVTVEYEFFSTWKELLIAAKNNKVDVVFASTQTPERDAYLLFPDPYIQLTNHLIVRQGNPIKKARIDEMQNQSIAVLDQSGLHQYIVRNHPSYKVVPLPDEFAVLTQLSLGNVDAAVMDMMRATYYIEEYGITNLRIVGDVQIPYNLTFGVVKTKPELYDVIQHGIQSIPNQVKQDIQNKWIHSRESDGIRKVISKYAMLVVGVIGACFLMLFGIFMAWNLTLKHQVEVKTRQLMKELQDRKAIQDDVLYRATHDMLTGLGNRSHMYDVLRERIAGGTPFALMFIDLDRFKRINDTYGHLTGDEMLKRVADRLKHSISSDNCIFRLGGDEFVIITPFFGENEPKLESIAKTISARIVTVLSSPIEIDGVIFKTTPSVGVALFPKDTTDENELLSCADVAMYAAKAAGRGVVRFFDQTFADDVTSSLRIERELIAAMANDELEVWYQPRVDAASNKIVAVEALVRWNHRLLGNISPAQFIPIAEESGLIGNLGAMVLKKATHDIANLKSILSEPFSVSVNVSMQQLDERLFEHYIDQALTESGLSPQSIEFEITESTVVADRVETRDALAMICRKHIKLALDDFGTGYSNLGHVKQLPIDVIKIDKTFVHDVLQDPNDMAIVRAIVTMSHELGMRVVAEGVETEDQAKFLTECGCDELQGFLFGKPMPLSQLSEFVKTFNS